MHPVAAMGFGRAAEAYQRGRPDYPAAAVDWLIAALDVAPGRTVIDVGAGTGKFTAQLVPTGATIIAVEPVDEMRAVLGAHVSSVTALAGTAEHLPLASASADAIVAAQAVHWFTMPAAADEFHRVLRERGRVGVIWNTRDESAGWVRALDEIIEPLEQNISHPSSHYTFELGPRFGEPLRATFAHVQRLTAEQLRDRVLSMSFVAALDAPDREEVLARVAHLARTHPELAGRTEFQLPYVTNALWAERR